MFDQPPLVVNANRLVHRYALEAMQNEVHDLAVESLPGVIAIPDIT